MPLLASPEEVAEATELADEYALDPIRFFVEVLGIDPDTIWPGMVEMAESVRDNRRTAVAACHDSSKTFTAAALSWWWVLCHMPAKVITTAPTTRQAESALWDEIHKLHGNAKVKIGGRLLKSEWQYAPGVFMLGFSTREDTGGTGATRFQGFKSPNNLIIFDEAVQISRGVWEATVGLLGMAHSHWLALGNPTDPASEFARCWRDGSKWNTMNISAFDTPNLLSGKPGKCANPYTPDSEWVEELRDELGEDHPLWQARVLGEFPDSAISTLISRAVLNAAFRRKHEDIRDEVVSIGCDVALEGDDMTVIVVVKGPCILKVERMAKRRGDEVGEAIHQTAVEFGIGTDQGHLIGIDSSGGYGEAPEVHLRHLGYGPNGEKFGCKAVGRDGEEKYRNRRTELWCIMAEWLHEEACLSNLTPKWRRWFEDDLPGCTVAYMADMRRDLERKDHMKKRLGHSPDHGDALALALAWRSRHFVSRPPRYGERERTRPRDAERLQPSQHPEAGDDRPRRRRGEQDLESYILGRR